MLVVFRPERLEHELRRLESARHVEIARNELVHAADRRRRGQGGRERPRRPSLIQGSFRTLAPAGILCPTTKTRKTLTEYRGQGGGVELSPRRVLPRELPARRAAASSRQCTDRNREGHLSRMRHAFASRMIARGIEPVTLAKLMGHEDIRETLNTYADLWDRDRTDETIRQAMALS